MSLGDISVSILPNTGLLIKEFRVAPKKGTGKGLGLKNLSLKLSLLPLLGGKLKIVNLSLEEPSLTIIKDASGVYLEGLPPATKEKQKKVPTKKNKAAPKEKKEKSAAGAGLPDAVGLNLESFRIDNASLTFDDRIAKKQYSYNDVDVTAALDLTANNVQLKKLYVNGTLLDTTALGVRGGHTSFQIDSGVGAVKDLAVLLEKNEIMLGASLKSNDMTG